MLKDIKENIPLITAQIGNLNREIEIIRQTQTEILELKASVSEIRGLKSLAVFNRLEMTEESENIEDKSIEIIQSEGLRGKKRMSRGVIHILLAFSRKREWGYLPPASKRLHWDYIQTTGPN